MQKQIDGRMNNICINKDLSCINCIYSLDRKGRQGMCKYDEEFSEVEEEIDSIVDIPTNPQSVEGLGTEGATGSINNGAGGSNSEDKPKSKRGRKKKEKDNTVEDTNE